MLATTLLYHAKFVGRPLAEIDALAQTVLPEIRSQRGPDMFCRSIQQLCLNIMGRCADPLLLAGESGYDERVVLPAARRENDTVSVAVATIMKLGLHFWLGDAAGALPVAKETEGFLAGLSGTPNVQLFHLVDALCRIQVAPGDRATARAVRRALALHGRWAAEAPENYAAPEALVRGAWLRAKGALDAAERHLDRAITLADEYRLPLVGALAHEQAAALYVLTGRVALQRIMIRAAYERWVSLDMVVRGEQLAREHPWLLSRDPSRRVLPPSTRPKSTGSVRRSPRPPPSKAWPRCSSARSRTRRGPAGSSCSSARARPRRCGRCTRLRASQRSAPETRTWPTTRLWCAAPRTPGIRCSPQPQRCAADGRSGAAAG